MSDYSRFSKSDIQIAQSKLNELCKKHNVKPFTLEKDNRGYKRLVDAMIGLEKQKLGRPPTFNKSDKVYLLKHLSAPDVFSQIVEGTPMPIEKLTASEKVERVLDDLINERPDLLNKKSREKLKSYLENLWNNKRVDIFEEERVKEGEFFESMLNEESA